MATTEELIVEIKTLANTVQLEQFKKQMKEVSSITKNLNGRDLLPQEQAFIRKTSSMGRAIEKEFKQPIIDATRKAKEWNQVLLNLGLSTLFFGMAVQRLANNLIKSGVASFRKITESTGDSSSAFAILGVHLELLKFTIGGALNALLNAWMPAIIEAITGTADWIEQHDKLVAKLLIFASIVGGAFVVAGTLTTFVNGIKSLIDVIKTGDAAAKSFKLTMGGLQKLIGAGLIIAVGWRMANRDFNPFSEDILLDAILAGLGGLAIAGPAGLVIGATVATIVDIAALKSGLNIVDLFVLGAKSFILLLDEGFRKFVEHLDVIPDLIRAVFTKTTFADVKSDLDKRLVAIDEEFRPRKTALSSEIRQKQGDQTFNSIARELARSGVTSIQNLGGLSKEQMDRLAEAMSALGLKSKDTIIVLNELIKKYMDDVNIQNKYKNIVKEASESQQEYTNTTSIGNSSVRTMASGFDSTVPVLNATKEAALGVNEEFGLLAKTASSLRAEQTSASLKQNTDSQIAMLENERGSIESRIAELRKQADIAPYKKSGRQLLDAQPGFFTDQIKSLEEQQKAIMAMETTLRSTANVTTGVWLDAVKKMQEALGIAPGPRQSAGINYASGGVGDFIMASLSQSMGRGGGLIGTGQFIPGALSAQSSNYTGTSLAASTTRPVSNINVNPTYITTASSSSSSAGRYT